MQGTDVKQGVFVGPPLWGWLLILGILVACTLGEWNYRRVKKEAQLLPAQQHHAVLRHRSTHSRKPARKKYRKPKLPRDFV